MTDTWVSDPTSPRWAHMAVGRGGCLLPQSFGHAIMWNAARLVHLSVSTLKQ